MQHSHPTLHLKLHIRNRVIFLRTHYNGLLHQSEDTKTAHLKSH